MHEKTDLAAMLTRLKSGRIGAGGRKRPRMGELIWRHVDPTKVGAYWCERQEKAVHEKTDLAAILTRLKSGCVVRCAKGAFCNDMALWLQ